MKQPAINLKPLTLVCPRIDAPSIDGHINEREWSRATRWTSFMRNDGSEEQSRTTVWFGHDDGYLYLAARCEEKNTDALQRTGSAYMRDLSCRDHMQVLLNPAHDHVGYCRISAGPFEQTETGCGTYTVGDREGSGSRWFHHSEKPDYGMYFRYASSVEDGIAWSFTMAIPFESLGAGKPVPGTVWGLNLMRHTAWPVYQGEPTRTSCPYPSIDSAEWSCLSVVQGKYPPNPLAYADLVFDPAAVQLLEADLGVPHFGSNSSKFRFKTATSTPLTLSASVRPRRPGRTIDSCAAIPLALEKPGIMSGTLTWMARPYDDSNVLDLTVRESGSDRTVWHATYDFGWEEGSMPLAYLHLGETDGVPPNPEPKDPEFLIKKSQYIAGRQPRFHRSNTFQGAPSDYTLESDDASIRFNLMDPACLDEMAKYIHNLYDNDTDRLLGMMFFAAQPAVMRAHTAYDPVASHRLETMSLLRFGSGYCGHMARVLAPILNRMEVGNTGVRHQAYCFGIGGHALVFVRHRDSYAIIDSKHATLYYRMDNTDLATVKELRENPEIGRRVYPYYMPALMTFDVEHLEVRRPDQLNGLGLILPEGAPVS